MTVHNDGILVLNARKAVKIEIAKKQALGLPVVEYSASTKNIYIKDANGKVTNTVKCNKGKLSESRK